MYSLSVISHLFPRSPSHRRVKRAIARPPSVHASPGSRMWVLTSSVASLLTGCVLGPLQLFVTPWTAAHQAPLFTGFSRQGYWDGCHLLLQLIG